MTDAGGIGQADAHRFGIPAPVHRLPGGTRVGGVRLQVADLDRSLEAYRATLGFEVLEREGGRLRLGAEGGGPPLIELIERPKSRPAPRFGRLGLYHFAILLPNREALGRILVHLRRRSVSPGMSDHGVSEALYLRDPDGLGIEIYADRPRDRWSVRGSELQMDTKPLDEVDVIAASDGRPWTGMPDGTTIGHIHLHVGDLELAREFYHSDLGFDVTAWTYSGALFFSAGGYHHHLGVNTWAGTDARTPGDDEARLLSWDLILPTASDVHAVIARLEQAGHQAIDDDTGGLVADPWGTFTRIASAS